MNASWMRHVFNVYPPFVGAGIHVTRIDPDWRYLRVEMPLRFYNRNYVGTHFGGSLYVMTDPFLMIMAIKNLGPDYVVWDKAAEISFVSPGRGRVAAEFRLTDADVQDMRNATADGSKYLPWFPVEVRAVDGTLVARVRKQLFVKKKPAAGGQA
jgi:acyl-coenzyme A thioesterase PaaI-like protein